ncbi:MAG: hypothetical protein ACR2HX_23710 [Pyrinomonadaceae bacterium]
MLQVRPIRVHPGAHFDAAIGAPADLAAAQIQRTHLPGRERKPVARLEVRAVAIEYAGDDLQGIAADVKEAEAERLPKGDAYGRQDIHGWVPVAITSLRAGYRSGQDCGEGDYADYNRAQLECLFESVSCVHDLLLTVVYGEAALNHRL